MVKDKVDVLSYFHSSQKRGQDQLQNLGIGGTIGFKWIIEKKKKERRVGIWFVWKYGGVAGLYIR